MSPGTYLMTDFNWMGRIPDDDSKIQEIGHPARRVEEQRSTLSMVWVNIV